MGRTLPRANDHPAGARVWKGKEFRASEKARDRDSGREVANEQCRFAEKLRETLHPKGRSLRSGSCRRLSKPPLGGEAATLRERPA